MVEDGRSYEARNFVDYHNECITNNRPVLAPVTRAVIPAGKPFCPNFALVGQHPKPEAIGSSIDALEVKRFGADGIAAGCPA
jgi:hypothetical protein